ncbi:ATP-grasp domain-containing protein [Kitasatospora sp. LaBMicrA B282]|uniref:ATP-grasp domain-containing protein n=1 Tax=Kitasatospora sp. LaBMicrA B282 TaxID=3420949 RepID=UPI003D0C4FE0
MPTTLVLSRQPLASRPLQEWVDDPADSVVLFTTEQAVAGAEDELAKYFPRHHLVADYHSWTAEAAAEQAARAFGVDRIACTSEHDVLRAARLRARLGLPGQQPASAAAYRDKVLMKQLAEQAGLAVPAFAAVDDPLDLLDFVDAVGFPVVVKPRSGCGSVGVHVLRDREGLEHFLAGEPESALPFLPGLWMAESFVTGELCHVDGVMADGRIVHAWPGQYSSGVAEYLAADTFISSVLLAAEDPRRAVLMAFAAELIAALPAAPDPIAFHLEAWICPDGRVVLCEIASRAGGALIAETYERAFGVHLAREGLRLQCGSEPTIGGQPAELERPNGWLMIPPGFGRFTPPAERCPVPGVDLTVQLAAGAVGHGVGKASNTAARALVSGATADEVRRRIDEVVAWWQRNASWS